jgi:hypothetical protein
MGDYGSSSVVSYTNRIRGFATLLEGLGLEVLDRTSVGLAG